VPDEGLLSKRGKHRLKRAGRYVMFKFHYLASLAGALLITCVGTMTQLKPEYRSMTVDSAKLGILVVRESVRIANPEEVTESLGKGDPARVLCDFLSDQLRTDAKTDGRFIDVTLITDCKAADLTEVDESFSIDDPITLRVPARGRLNADSLPYILVIDNIKVSRTAGAPGNPVLTGTCVLWDTRAGKTVSFGRINEKGGVGEHVTVDLWKGMVKNISGRIFGGMPFGRG
jgi:hypothetical protein